MKPTNSHDRTIWRRWRHVFASEESHDHTVLRAALGMIAVPLLGIGTNTQVQSQPIADRQLGIAEAAPDSGATPFNNHEADGSVAEFPRLDLFGDELPEGAIARLGTIRFRHPERALSVAIAPDASMTASSSYYGDVRLWETATGRLLRVLHPTSARPVTTVAFSPDGRFVVAGGEDRTLRIWRSGPGELVGEISLGNENGDKIQSISFARDGRTVATGLASGMIRIWDIGSGTDLLALPPLGRANSIDHAVALSPTGERLAAAPRRGSIDLWTFENVDGKLTLSADENPMTLELDARESVVSMAMTPEGDELIVGSALTEPGLNNGRAAMVRRSKVRIWNLQEGGPPRELSREDGDAGASLVLARNGQILATSTQDEVLIWDFRSGRVLRSMGGVQNNQMQASSRLALSPDGTRVAVTHGSSTEIVAWDATTGKLLPERFNSHASRIMDVGFCVDDCMVTTQDAVGLIRTWNADTGEPSISIQTPGALTRGGAVNGRFILDSSYARDPDTELPGTVDIWDVATGERMDQQFLTERITCSAVSADGTLAAAAYSGIRANGDRFGAGESKGAAGIRVWNPVSHKLVAERTMPDENVVVLALAPDKQSLRYLTIDGSMVAWDFAAGEEETLITGMKGVDAGLSTGIAISQDLRTAVVSERGRPTPVAGGAQGRVQYVSAAYVYDIERKEERLAIKIPDTINNMFAISPDSRMLATAGVQVTSRTQPFDEAIYLWDLRTGEQIKRVGQPDAAVTAMDFSSDGQRLVTATAMGTALVWDLR